MPKNESKGTTYTGPAQVLFETPQLSIKFSDGGNGWLLIQSPADNREAIVLDSFEVQKLHHLLSGIVGRG